MKWRRALVLPPLAAIFGVLVWGYTGLPEFGTRIGEYGNLINQHVGAQRHITNYVTAVMFDYRGLDTMVEEFILFTAVMGLVLLLRSGRDAAEQRPRDVVTSDAVRTVGGTLAPVLLLFGLWVITFGYITPGGGFQGGVIASAGALMLWAAGSYRHFRRLTPSTLLDATEGLGAAAYVAVGFLGLTAGAAFLTNTMPLGSAGTLASSGTIAALNWAAGIEVTAAFVLIYHEFIEEYVQPKAER
ncbi:MnhB domain-containing protein [Actinomadura sp. BRA 177]|uniref:MnhB domain-containing protein n=1 Tax=Actinomadura sp. BRA 177 TaxID=2745202 RepID=UPI0015956095|nr:MnhB domain-containing protein [Actinomadura sp. BRA 177]NVI89215.1 sodium:proton antiporter [Actinomadura sp. BRA 177]